MTAELDEGIRASRFHVPRSRGALSGIALIVLGAWATLVPFIGPYFNFAFTPAPNNAWHWTADRGWLELLPGVAAFVAGLLLLAGTHRISLTFASWLGVASGAWLVVNPLIAPRISLSTGTPDPTSGAWVQTLEWLFFYYAIGAGIVFFAATALGRVSVHRVGDARRAQRRAEAAAAREAERQRIAEEREREAAAERERFGAGVPPTDETGRPRHERAPGDPNTFAPTSSYPAGTAPGGYPEQSGAPSEREYPPA